jgi:hypothetical protein
MNDLERTLDKHKIKEMDMTINISNLKKKNLESQEEIKDLKAKMYEAQRILRKIPHKKQIYYNANSEVFDFSNFS